MKKEIPIRFIKEDEQETTETEKEQEKTIKEINITTMKIAIIWSVLLFIWLFTWMLIINASQDNTIQDNIQKIEQSTKQINYLSWIIQKAQSWIIVENQNISKAKQVLKSKNLEYIK